MRLRLRKVGSGNLLRIAPRRYDVHVLKDDKITDVHVSITDGRITEEKPLERHHAANTKSMPMKADQRAGKS